MQTPISKKLDILVRVFKEGGRQVLEARIQKISVLTESYQSAVSTSSITD
jgi:hypothetical protein